MGLEYSINFPAQNCSKLLVKEQIFLLYFFRGDEYMLLKIGEAAEYLGVVISTLRRWEYEGKIKPIRTVGNQRRYDTDILVKLKKMMLRIDIQ